MDVRTKSLRLPPDIAERLRLVAFRLRKSQNTIIVEALAAALDRQEEER